MVTVGTGEAKSTLYLYDGGLNALGTVADDVGLPHYLIRSVRDATGINAKGQIVGSRPVSSDDPWYYPLKAYLCETSAGVPQFQDLGGLPMGDWPNSEALAINDVGVVVGRVYSSANGVEVSRAFRWLPGGPMQDLNSLVYHEGPVLRHPWQLVSATGINNAGEIVGTAMIPMLNEFRLCPVLLKPHYPDSLNLELQATVDPLALILSNQIYQALTKWDPQPPASVLAAKLRGLVAWLEPRERALVFERLSTRGKYARAVVDEFRKG